MCAWCINCKTVASNYFAIDLVLLYVLFIIILPVLCRFRDIECCSFSLENKSYIYILPTI